jgi:hypothetical protein
MRFNDDGYRNTKGKSKKLTAREATMSIYRLFSLFVALALVVVVAPTTHAGIATSEVVSSGPDLLDCLQRQPGSAIPSDTAAPDWVERHAASLKAGIEVDLPDYIQRHSGSAIPADRGAASDWVERYAASLKASNAADLSDYVQQQPGSAVRATTAASDWIERHAASLKAGNAVVSGC